MHPGRPVVETMLCDFEARTEETMQFLAYFMSGILVLRTLNAPPGGVGGGQGV